MTNQPTNENEQSAMPVISYAPVEDHNSPGILLRLVIGWFLIITFVFRSLFATFDYLIVLGFFPSRFVTTLATSPWYAHLYYLHRTIIYLAISISGMLLIRRNENAIKFIQGATWLSLISIIVLSILQIIAMALNWMNVRDGIQIYYAITTGLGLPFEIILPIFILILTTPRIASIYK